MADPIVTNDTAPKLQKDVVCGVNSDRVSVRAKYVGAKAESAGAVLDKTLAAGRNKARGERVDFLALHCPVKDETHDCAHKQNDKQDDLVEVVVAIKPQVPASAGWEAEVTVTWAASFECVKPS